MLLTAGRESIIVSDDPQTSSLFSQHRDIRLSCATVETNGATKRRDVREPGASALVPDPASLPRRALGAAADHSGLAVIPRDYGLTLIRAR